MNQPDILMCQHGIVFDRCGHCMLQRISELEHALRFYADKRRYLGPNQHPIPNDPYQPENMRSYMYDTCRDNGDIARKALGL